MGFHSQKNDFDTIINLNKSKRMLINIKHCRHFDELDFPLPCSHGKTINTELVGCFMCLY
jgi:hypothetical protein